MNTNNAMNKVTEVVKYVDDAKVIGPLYQAPITMYRLHVYHGGNRPDYVMLTHNSAMADALWTYVTERGGDPVTDTGDHGWSNAEQIDTLRRQGTYIISAYSGSERDKAALDDEWVHVATLHAEFFDPDADYYGPEKVATWPVKNFSFGSETRTKRNDDENNDV